MKYHYSLIEIKKKKKKQKKNKINNNNSTNTDKIIYNNCSRSTQYKKN